MDPKQLAQIIATEASETKAQDIKILDLGNLVSYTDYFVLVTGTSTRQVQAIADRVAIKLKTEFKLHALSQEGYATGQWVLLDYGSVVLHAFLAEAREFYGLDLLWPDAKRVAWEEKTEAKKPDR